MAFEIFNNTVPYWQIYLLIGIVCAFLEIFAPGFILLPIGVALILTGGICIFIDQLILQLLVLAALLFIVFFVSRRWTAKKPTLGINTGVNDLVGKVGICETPISSNLGEKGYVKVYGDSWQALLAEGSDEAKAGEKVTIVAIEGNKIIVKKV